MIKEVEVNNAFEKEIQPDESSIDIIDCYVGCQLQCPYCFQMNDSDWSKDIFVRMNIATILEQQLNEHDCGELFIGSLSDPYMPLEGKYRLTRKCLQVLCKSNKHVYVTTKSNNELILQDMDVLKNFKNPVTILLGLSSMDQAGKGANNVNIKVANELKMQGIDVWVYITPILPYVMNVDEMISSVDKDIPIFLDKLRVMTEGNQDKKIYNWIQREYPQYTKEYEKILFELDETYYQKIVEKYRNNGHIKFMFENWGL